MQPRGGCCESCVLPQHLYIPWQNHLSHWWNHGAYLGTLWFLFFTYPIDDTIVCIYTTYSLTSFTYPIDKTMVRVYPIYALISFTYPIDKTMVHFYHKLSIHQ